VNQQQRLGDMTLRDIGKGLSRYQPFIIAVLAVILVVVFLPGTKKHSTTVASSGPQTEASNGAAATPGATQSADASGTAAAQAAAAASAATGRAASSARQALKLGGALANVNGAPPGPDCDAATGRIKIPSLYAYPCLPAFSGDNGGATSPGVTKDAINIVAYVGQPDAATQAVLAAGGDTDTDANRDAQRHDFVTYFQHHYETYGRKINLINLAASGATADDAAAKADAIRAATEMHAFMVWNGPTSLAWVNELTARHVICVCTTTLPKDFYLRHAPYVWGNGLHDENQAYIMRAEYIWKRLAGRPAQWAGDANLKPPLGPKARTFGLIYYDTNDHAYTEGEKFFEEELGRHGVSLVDRAGYVFDTASAQQTADTIMSKFKSEGITSVIFVGDPIYPAFYTQSATNQNYHPEWVVTGSALTDTTLFGRVYDKNQWSHAFGVSLLNARAPKTESDPYRLYKWQFPNQEPPAKAEYNVIYPYPWITFTGIALAGPNLTPATFRDGLFSYPVTPKNPGVTAPRESFGRKLWAWDDYNVIDDSTQIFWDATATGPDENGATGVGMYRYVDMGKRYLPGQFPTGEPPNFDNTNTVTVYDTLPPQDRYPSYPEKDYH
jgi:hypothetical protein